MPERLTAKIIGSAASSEQLTGAPKEFNALASVLKKVQERIPPEALNGLAIYLDQCHLVGFLIEIPDSPDQEPRTLFIIDQKDQVMGQRFYLLTPGDGKTVLHYRVEADKEQMLIKVSGGTTSSEKVSVPIIRGATSEEVLGWYDEGIDNPSQSIALITANPDGLYNMDIDSYSQMIKTVYETIGLDSQTSAADPAGNEVIKRLRESLKAGYDLPATE